MRRLFVAGRQAKVLAEEHVDDLRAYAWNSRYPQRNDVIVLLSVRAGLRAAEIAGLTWDMVVTPDGSIGESLELHNRIAKGGRGRRVPLHPDLRLALIALHRKTAGCGEIVRSERGGPMLPVNIVHWFAKAYRALGLRGCSSHSGRRTFITRAARTAHAAGASLRDVQLLAGHHSIKSTERYIEGDTDAQRRLVAML